MSDENSKNAKVEGEGSYTGTRNYNKHVAEHQQQEDVDALADEAREAVEGQEGEELKNAEQKGKAGPNPRPVERVRH